MNVQTPSYDFLQLNSDPPHHHHHRQTMKTNETIVSPLLKTNNTFDKGIIRERVSERASERQRNKKMWRNLDVAAAAAAAAAAAVAAIEFSFLSFCVSAGKMQTTMTTAVLFTSLVVSRDPILSRFSSFFSLSRFFVE